MLQLLLANHSLAVCWQQRLQYVSKVENCQVAFYITPDCIALIPAQAWHCEKVMTLG